MITRNQRKLNLQKAPVAACQPSDPDPETSPIRGEGEGSTNIKNKRIGIHAVTTHSQTSEKSSDEQLKGQRGKYPARQDRVGDWSSGEETELRRLVGLNTNPKGLISWVKVSEAWNLMNLPLRTKASLSSKWRDIRSRDTILVSADDQNNVGLAGTSDNGDQQHPNPPPVNSQVVNIAVVSSADPPTTSMASGDPDPGGDNPHLAHGQDDSGMDDIKKIFCKCLIKSRKIGCEGDRIAPKRVIPNSYTQSIVKKIDDLMKDEVDQRMGGKPSWNQLSILVYAGAMAVDRICNQPFREKLSRSEYWFSSSYREIERLRKVIGKATAEMIRRRNAEVAPSKKQLSNIRLLEKKYRCTTFVELTSLVEQLKGRLALLLARAELRRADEQRSRVRHMPSKLIFRDKASPDSTDTVNIHKIRQYWKGIVGVKKSFDHNNIQLKNWKCSMPSTQSTDDLSDRLTMETWEKTVSNIKPWKAPGPDGLQSYWWKSFKTAHTSLFLLVKHHISSGSPLPQEWISCGKIILLYKSGLRSDPANYRPIACLNTCYKLLTGYVAAYLNEYVTERAILPKEQRALQKDVWGCTHALLIDQTIVADARNQRGRRLSVGWIDYAKAFDSVPHSYINWLLQVMRVPNQLRTFIKCLMSSWKVKYEAKDLTGKTERSSFLRIRSGVLQGDSFSPLLFCLAMAPISHALNNTKFGYKIACEKSKVFLPSLSHQFYMDDLKLYADSEESLRKLLQMVGDISLSISMKINLKKCAVAHFMPKHLQNANDGNNSSPLIQDYPTVEGGLHYKYLGMEQEFNSNEKLTWERVSEKCIKKFKQIWASDLTFRQKVDTYNTTIIPALTYVSSNNIKGSGKYSSALMNGSKLDILLRDHLVKEKARYEHASKARPYLSVEKGGYGMKSIEDAIEESTIYTWAYLCTRADTQASYELFKEMSARGKRSILSDAKTTLSKYNIDVEMEETSHAVIISGVRYEKTTKLARHVVGLMRDANNTMRFNEWNGLVLAGRVLHHSQTIDLVTSFEWLSKGRLSSIGVRNAIAVQEGCLLTRAHPTFNNTGQVKSCRKCGASRETIQHVVSNCKLWLTTLYIDRHDSVARNIHYILCIRYELVPPHYSQRISPVMENDKVRLYWNQPVQTRTVIKHNKPDLVVFDKVKKTALVIEVAVSWFTGMNKQKEIKINRYCVNSNFEKDEEVPYPRGDNLVKELQTSGWSVVFLPIVIGTTGEVLVDFVQEVKDKLHLNHQASLKLLERLQRSAVLGTSRIVKNHLST